MTQLIRLEADDPAAGGFQITMPSGHAMRISWYSNVPIYPTLEAAKEYAAKTLQALLDSGRLDDAERTNWASVTAAIQRIIMDFNDVTSKRIHLAAGH